MTPSTSTAPSTRSSRAGRPIIASVLLALLAVLAVASPAGAHPRPSPDLGSPGCQRRDVSVTLAGSRTAPRYRVAGWLCRPRHATRTVQLLVSGFTYDHAYWLGASTPTSWTAAALAHGDAVYMIDPVGVGASDHPPAAQVTTSSQAETVHQITAALYDGTLGRYPSVVGVGHSYGSIILAAEAAQHRDLTALVLTSKLPQYNQPGLTAFHNALYPAASDPKFAHANLPDGYVTTPPGTRPDFFLDPDTALPQAAAWEESHKDVGTTGELATMTADAYAADSLHITVPVLLIDGSHDSLSATPRSGATPAPSCASACRPSTRRAHRLPR
jgi:pimeloyl-ACP methyl ester carboxylesterase